MTRKRRKPPEFSFLEASGGKKVRGGGQITESGTRLFTGDRRKKLPELANKWMSKGKKRMHKLERREGKQETKDVD